MVTYGQNMYVLIVDFMVVHAPGSSRWIVALCLLNTLSFTEARTEPMTMSNNWRLFLFRALSFFPVTKLKPMPTTLPVPFLPTFVFCRTDFSAGSAIFVACNCVFHRECLEEWRGLKDQVPWTQFPRCASSEHGGRTGGASLGRVGRSPVDGDGWLKGGFPRAHRVQD